MRKALASRSYEELKTVGGSNLTQKVSKAKEKALDVLAMLDKADADVESNPGAMASTRDSEFHSMFEDSDTGGDINVGDIVQGTIVEVQSDYVLVDINYKSEGLIHINEFRLTEDQKINPGDTFEVYVDRMETENGMVGLSKEKADMLRAWNDISRAAENEEIIEGTVISKVKGGLSVDIGVKAFLPGSQIDLRPVRNMDIYLGNKYRFKVIKFNKQRGNIVLSRRAILEEERESKRSETLDQMSEGAVVVGSVKNITDYGVFIDLGGMDGLLHITDMSWGRVKHPSEMIKVGEDIEVKVLKFDSEKERVSLGLKQLTEDPWEAVRENYPIEKKLSGEVVSVADYGAFMQLGDGIEGLIHVSEMSWTKRIKHPSEVVSVGDVVDVVVLDVDMGNRRISLGMKQLQMNPWVQAKETYPLGTIIEGAIKSVTDFGVFMEVGDGIDGLIHVSDFSWTKRIGNPSDIYKKGDNIRAVVLGVDIDNERFSLGLKQLESDPWTSASANFAVGTQHEVKVTKTADFGVFVELTDDIEGLIHISELSDEKIEKAEDFAKEGDTIKAEVIMIDKDARKVSLSSKLVRLREKRVGVENYAKNATSTSKATMGDVFSQTFESFDKPKDEEAVEAAGASEEAAEAEPSMADSPTESPLKED